MRKFLLYLAICSLWAGSEETPWQAQSEEEALFLRRIADFWTEGEYQIAKSQMEEFLASFPESSFSDSLCSTLGDLYLRDRNYPAALEFYARIRDPKISTKVFLNRMQCLYSMEWYATLSDACETFLQREDLTDTQKTYTTYYLATSLYQQCLTKEKGSNELTTLAKRAASCFETLLQTELKPEIVQAFAHICCILKEFPKAASLYENLAEIRPEEREEFLFQAALVQSEYDPEKASKTFAQIARMGDRRAREATFNRLVLTFEMGHHKALIRHREKWLRQVPEGKQSAVHLFLGRSHLALKDYAEACKEFELYLAKGAPCETFRAALISLLDAAFQSNNLVFLDFAIQKMHDVYPNDPEIARGLFSRALILKKGNRMDEARKELENLLAAYPQFPQVAQALFELAHLDYQDKNWAACREKANLFLAKYPTDDLAPYAWHYLVASSAELTHANPQSLELKEQFAMDLEKLLQEKKGGSNQKEWLLLLAKTNFELTHYEKAIEILNPLVKEESASPNAKLLLALCYRNGLGDLAAFCSLAEEALKEGATLLDRGSLHSCLFNAYLERSTKNPELVSLAEEHLFGAFQEKQALRKENLVWLSDRYFQKIVQQDDLGLPVENELLARTKELLKHLQEEFPSQEACNKLGKVYLLMNEPQAAIQLLEPWAIREDHTQLLLAQAYEAIGEEEKAIQTFEEIVTEPSVLRKSTGALAFLRSARLRWKKSDHVTALKHLKDLVLQKTLSNEPLHLEAALDYIDYQSDINHPEKRIALLRKSKEDFETKNDLLSKDYHEARVRSERKNQIYQAYMLFFDAEILLAESHLGMQKELQAKAKDILLQIMKDNAHPALVNRAKRALQQADAILFE